MRNRFLMPAAALASALYLAGCATAASTPAASAPAAAPAAPAAPAKLSVFMMVPESGRLHVFTDMKTYLMYKEVGEVPYTRTRIGAGPQGQTVVFGLTAEEVRSTAPSAAERLLDGTSPADPSFYGEVFRGGRYHVFSSWHDLQDYLKNGEIIFTFTRIGEGPKGATVIYALNKETVKQTPPNAMIEAFKRLHGAR